ncbi:MAG: T9SS type A sorting domain-containing protein [Bacteroidetes bacterium]|nr:T9SS type A sorting domain-containing protein [Bacteroidota bacterium]
MKQYLQFILGIVLIFFLCSKQPVFGQILMLDNFDYPAGDLLTDHNWLQQQTTSTFPIVATNGGLTHTGYIGSGIGNATALGVEGQDVFRGFVKQTLPGTVYMSFLAKVTAATPSGDFFISLKESATSPTNANYRGRVWAKTDGSGNLAFGVTKGAMTAPMVPNYTEFLYSLNTTYLLVLKFTIVEGTPNDSAMLFINPVIGSPEPAPAVICPDVMTGTDLGVGSVLLRQGLTGTSPSVIVDGVRVSKTWATALTVSNISTLSDLKVDGITVTGFSPTLFAYNDTVPAGQTTVAIASSNTCMAATSSTTAATSIPGYSTVHIVAENGTSTSTYTVTHAYAYFMIGVSGTPGGSGTATGGGVYGQGFLATVAAAPASGYIFNNWTEGGVNVSGEPVYTFTVQNNRDLVANFLQIMYVVAATPVPADGGVVSGTGTFPSGSNITLSASPLDGFIFENWQENGTIVGTDPNFVITNLSGNRIMEAHFIPSTNTFTVTGTPNPPEAGTITGSGNVTAGGSITLDEIPNWGYVFLNWTENSVILGTSTSLTITNIQSNHSIIANFRPIGVGMDEKNPTGVEVYPTLAKDIVHVKSQERIEEVQMIDLGGKLIWQIKVGENTAIIPVSLYSKGIYLVRIITGNGVFIRRIIKGEL